MKTLKKLTAIMLVLAMVLSLGITAFATVSNPQPDPGLNVPDNGPYSITINDKENVTGATALYAAYQIFKGNIQKDPNIGAVLTDIEWGDGVITGADLYKALVNIKTKDDSGNDVYPFRDAFKELLDDIDLEKVFDTSAMLADYNNHVKELGILTTAKTTNEDRITEIGNESTPGSIIGGLKQQIDAWTREKEDYEAKQMDPDDFAEEIRKLESDIKINQYLIKVYEAEAAALTAENIKITERMNVLNGYKTEIEAVIYVETKDGNTAGDLKDPNGLKKAQEDAQKAIDDAISALNVTGEIENLATDVVAALDKYITAADVAQVLSDNLTNTDLTIKFADVVGKNLLSSRATRCNDNATTPHAAGNTNESNGEHVISGLASGYYIVVDETTPDGNNDADGTHGLAKSRFILGVVGNMTVTAKSDAPELDKAIVEGDNRVDQNAVGIGDAVNYELTSHVPNMTGYDQYTFTIWDKLSKGLTYNEGVTATITKDDGTGTSTTEAMTTNVTYYVPLEVYLKYTVKQESDIDKATDTKYLEKDGGKYYEVEYRDYADIQNHSHETGCGTDPAFTCKYPADGTDVLIKIDFPNFIQYKDAAYTATTDHLDWGDIKVTYSATLNRHALRETKVGNPNEAQLEFSNDPTWKRNPGNPNENPPTGETPWDKVTTYTTELQITKTDDKTPARNLSGAVFTVEKVDGTWNNVVRQEVKFEADDNANPAYYELQDGTYTTTAPNGNNNSAYKDPTQKYKRVERTVIVEGEVKEPSSNKLEGLEVSKDGILSLKELGPGNYVITETKSPNGYNKLKAKIYVHIEDNYDEHGNITWSAWYNIIDTTEGDAASNPYYGKTNAEIFADFTEGADTNHYIYWTEITVTNAYDSPNDSVVPLTVINVRGLQLPGTGGMGTYAFYGVGGLLVVLAAAVLLTKKRTAKER